jgi:predicted transcriptional regulator
MPQSERAEILKKMLRWLLTKENGATVQAILIYTKWEITEGGATDNAIKKYIEDLKKALLIEYKQPFWKITKAGKNWLERHNI